MSSSEDSRKLFVAGLPESITEDKLRQLFEATGGTVINVSLPKDRATGRPRGFGFVTMASPNEANAARDSLNGSIHSGTSISVRPFEAEPPKRGPALAPSAVGGGGEPRAERPAPTPESTLYVGNLPYDASSEELDSLINSVGAGPVVRIHMPTDPDGRKRGFGFVTLSSAQNANTALEALRGADLRGRQLHINIAHPKGEKPAFGDREPRSGGGGFAGGGGFDRGAPPPAPDAGGGDARGGAARRRTRGKGEPEHRFDEGAPPAGGRSRRRQEKERHRDDEDFDYED
jgi:RNA recognition motif-containing protein